jgi:hypothetical protein
MRSFVIIKDRSPGSGGKAPVPVENDQDNGETQEIINL